MLSTSPANLPTLPSAVVALHLAGVSLVEAFDTAVDYASITRLV